MKLKYSTLLRPAGAMLLAISAAISARADYQSTVLSQGPVGYWRLNETTQPAQNGSATNVGSLGLSANGAYNNSPTRALAGPFAGSSSVGLDGTSQTISTPWQAGINGATFSFEIWANPTTIPKFAYLASSVVSVSPRSGWYLAQDDGSTFGHGSAWVCRAFNQNATSPYFEIYAPVSAGWTHLAITFDGSTASFYTNGVLCSSTNKYFVTPATPLSSVAYVPNVSQQVSLGQRAIDGFFWPGKQAEVAMYTSALTAGQISTHYTTANSTPANYASTVLGDSPVLYYRFKESPDVTTANIGSLGSAANAKYQVGTAPGSVGPRPSAYPGFETTNNAVTFNASGASVSVPALNLNTNAITITGWVKAIGSQNKGSGLIVCNSGSTYAGLTIDHSYAGFGLGYVWAGDISTYGWSPSVDAGLPGLPDSDWAFVSLIVRPNQASIYICASNNVANFIGVTNTFTHPLQAFGGATLFGSDGGASTLALNGSVDEVAIFNRALGIGELYTQYGAAVGGVAPVVFVDPQSPSQPVVIGDTLSLTVDAGGTPNLTYFWRKNSSTVLVGTSNVYTKANFSFSDVGAYDVIVSNVFGTALSGQALVQGQNANAPTNVSGPVSRTLYTGGTLNLTVSAQGGGLKYQWKRSNTNLPGATSATYLVSSVTTNDAGSYSVSITNTLGATNFGPVVITIPTVTTNSYEGVIIAAAPEAWWRLDETAGSTNMWDGMGRHDGYYTNLNGTVPPVALGVTGLRPSDSAASFSASGGVGVVPFSANLNSAKFTYEGWVNTTVLNNINLTPFSSTFAGNGLWWRTLPTGFWSPDSPSGYLDINGNGNTASPMVSGVWTHLVMEYDSTRFISGVSYPWTFYINGVGDPYVYGNTLPGANTAGPFIIGGHGVDANTLADEFFSGLVDEVAVYTRILTVAEITNHYALGFPPTPPIFVVQPQPQNAFVGQSATFSASVAGGQPIALLWKKNGVSLPGQTNSTLTVSNVYYTDSGALYSLAATNSSGGAISSNAVLTVYYPPNFANLTNGLVLHLPFDGSYNDTSGHGHNGTPVGSPTFVAGTVGSQSLNYTTTTLTNGSGNPSNVTVSATSYVNLGLPADLQFSAGVSFSVGLWVKLPANYAGGDLPFIGTGIGSMNNPGWDMGPTYGTGGWQWCLNDGVQVQAITNNIDVGGAANSINDGNWHNFVLTVDRAANTARSYIDGAPAASRDITGLGSLDNGSSVTIGQDPTAQYPTISPATQNDLTVWGPLQQATLDDLGIWRRALTDLEARSIYYVGLSGKSFDTFGPVVLSLAKNPSGNYGITWQSGTLKQANSLLGPWTPVPGATAPFYQFTPSTTNTFFGVGP